MRTLDSSLRNPVYIAVKPFISLLGASKIGMENSIFKSGTERDFLPLALFGLVLVQGRAKYSAIFSPHLKSIGMIRPITLRQFYVFGHSGIIREREQINLKACGNCQEEEDTNQEEKFLIQSSRPLLERQEQGQIEAAFHCQTRKNISIERRSLQEIQLYYIPKKEEMFHRGLGLNLNNGQYKAPLSGYYIFTATLHIIPKEYPKRNQPRVRDRLRLLICVQSLCRRNSSLETVSGLDKNSEHFTISVSGILFLQAGQYASVFVDNATGSSLTVRRGSDFRAVLLGT
uniref:Erythroferrone n=1 Tax=Varanus komodoensis TaxID=61221 RepID=A0A8D2Q5J6_VARKO